MTAQDYRTRKALEISFRRWLSGSTPALALVSLLSVQDPATYRAHLESQFDRGMSWENYGRAWQVDHVVPLSLFRLADPSEVRLAWAVDNLRPLTLTANKARGASAADSVIALRSRPPVCAVEHVLLLDLAEEAFAAAYPHVTLTVSAGA